MNRGLRRIAATLGCVLALQLTAACSTGDARPSSAPPPSSGPALWKVADKDTTIYLFGTIHFLPTDVKWFDGRIERALGSATELVTEIDSEKDYQITELMAQNGFLPAGQSLRDRLNKADRVEFEALLVSLGIPIEQFDRYKPWSAGLFLSVLMTRIAGFDPQEGVEQVIDAKAPPGIPHTALESIEFQVELFNSLPEAQQIAYLNQVVASAGTLKQSLDAMLESWLAGDAEALAKLVNAEESDPALYRRMLVDRNADWAVWVKERLEQPGTVFVAVGAGHLAGKGSLQDQLRTLGIKSKRVP